MPIKHSEEENDGSDGDLFKALSYIAYAAKDAMGVEPNIERRFQTLVKAVEDSWPHTPEEQRRSPVAKVYNDFLENASRLHRSRLFP